MMNGSASRTNKSHTWQGYVVTKVTIDPAEFTQYCHRTGSDYDPFSLDDLANFKGSTGNPNPSGRVI
jgi:hypothetical protein